MFVGTATTSAVFDGFPPASARSSVASEVASASYRDPVSWEERLVTVELNGCQRVIEDAHVPQQAPRELLEELSER